MKSKRNTKTRPTPTEKKTRLSKKYRITEEKHNLSNSYDSSETCLKYQPIDTIYEDTISNDNKCNSTISSNNQTTDCLICGDNTELPEHKVCFWHAVTQNNVFKQPLYEDECNYSLIKYSEGNSYLHRVNQKKKSTLDKFL
tara:strand:+ start:160 stop:582 length:423 start_codon:yes stop_codon:yes gene_type:complete